jgi:hypothetical protein
MRFRGRRIILQILVVPSKETIYITKPSKICDDLVVPYLTKPIAKSKKN